MENKNDREKLKEMLEYISTNFLRMNRAWLKDIMASLSLSQDPFVIKHANFFHSAVERGNEIHLKSMAGEILDSAEFTKKYDTREKVMIKTFPRERLAQARSFKTRKTKEGYEVEEQIRGNEIWIRWREDVLAENVKVFPASELESAIKFSDKKEKEGVKVTREIVKEEVVVRWETKDENDSINSMTRTEKPDTPLNLKK